MAEYAKRWAGYSSNGCHVKTRACISEYEFIWTVEKFSKCPSTLRSVPFHAFPYTTWEAILSLSDDNLRLYFECSEKPSDSMRIHSEVQDCNGRLLYKENAEKPSERVQSSQVGTVFSYWGTTVQSSLTGVLNYKYSIKAINNVSSTAFSEMKQLPGDVVIFKCTIETCVHTTETDTYRFQARAVKPSPDLLALSNDLKTMLDVSLYADVDVHVGDSVLHAHKSILCARSPVFSKMFENPMDERAKNTIKIIDVKLPVVKNLLSFLYTGSLSDDGFEAVHDLYYAADKYDVSNLRQKCADVLLSKMEVHNACRALTLASRHCDEDLKMSVMAYIQFYFDAVLKTDSWADLVSHEPKLASEVMSHRGEKRKTED